MLFLPCLLPDMIWISEEFGGPLWTCYAIFLFKNNRLMVAGGLWWVLLNILDLLAHLLDQHLELHGAAGGVGDHRFRR